MAVVSSLKYTIYICDVFIFQLDLGEILRF